MTDYIKQNFPALLVGIALVFILFFGIKVNTPPITVIVPESSGSGLGAINRNTTTISNPFTFQQGVTINANANGTSNSLTSVGTSTLQEMLFYVGGTISTAATGTPITLDANTTGPKLCFGGSAALAVRNRGIFSPALVISIGTSTASVTTTNLIASTTIATSTPATSTFNSVSSDDDEFVYQDGDEIMAIVGQANDNASSTHLGNFTADFRILCSELEI